MSGVISDNHCGASIDREILILVCSEVREALIVCSEMSYRLEVRRNIQSRKSELRTDDNRFNVG